MSTNAGHFCAKKTMTRHSLDGVVCGGSYPGPGQAGPGAHRTSRELILKSCHQLLLSGTDTDTALEWLLRDWEWVWDSETPETVRVTDWHCPCCHCECDCDWQSENWDWNLNTPSPYYTATPDDEKHRNGNKIKKIIIVVVKSDIYNIIRIIIHIRNSFKLRQTVDLSAQQTSQQWSHGSGENRRRIC